MRLSRLSPHQSFLTPSDALDPSVGRLYRGLLPPLLMEAPKRATKLYVFLLELVLISQLIRPQRG